MKGRALIRWRFNGGVDNQQHLVSSEPEVSALASAKNLTWRDRPGAATLRHGYTSIYTGTVTNADYALSYRDEAWGKDVVVVYSKHGTLASRALYVFSRTIGAGGAYTLEGSRSYGTIELPDEIIGFAHRAAARLGGGTGANEIPVKIGYVSRTNMFGAVSFSGVFMQKQQFVQKPDVWGYCGGIVYDSINDQYFAITSRGVERRDASFRLLEIAEGIHCEQDPTSQHFVGSISMSPVSSNASKLLAVGTVPGAATQRVFQWNITKGGFELEGSAQPAGGEIRSVYADSTKYFLLIDDGTLNANVKEYSYPVKSTATATRYTGDRSCRGLGADTTNLYTLDNAAHNLVKFPKAGGAPSNYNHAETLTEQADVITDGTDIFWLDYGDLHSSAGNVYKTNISTFNSHSSVFNDTELSYARIADLNGDPAVISQSYAPLVRRFTDYTFATEDLRVSDKLLISAQSTVVAGDADTFFYAVAVEDTDGQLSHLVKGCSVNVNWDGTDFGTARLVVTVDLDAELYAEQASPSRDASQVVSTWNEFRRWNKIHIFRASAPTKGASAPTTNYVFHSTLDIDDAEWQSVGSNPNYQRFYRVITDDTPPGQISTHTWNEFSGSIEDVFPEHVRWGTFGKLGGTYYYGNIRHEELEPQLIIRSEQASPDSIHYSAEQVFPFNAGDGDEIVAITQAWGRLLVFKRNITGVFADIDTLETTEPLGCESKHGARGLENIVYFIGKEGLNAWKPGEIALISRKIDTAFASMSAPDARIELDAAQDYLYLFDANNGAVGLNLRTGVWEALNFFNALGATPAHIGRLSYGPMLVLDNAGDIYAIDGATFQDGSGDITWSMETQAIEPIQGMKNARMTKAAIRYEGSGFTLKLLTISSTGEKTQSFTIPTSSLARSHRLNISSAWGQSFRWKVEDTAASASVTLHEILGTIKEAGYA